MLDIARHLGLHCLKVQVEGTRRLGFTLADALTQYQDIDALRPKVIAIELLGKAAADAGVLR